MQSTSMNVARAFCPFTGHIKLPFDFLANHICKPFLIMGFFYGAMKGFCSTNCGNVHPIQKLYFSTIDGIISGVLTVISIVTNPWIPIKMMLQPIAIMKSFYDAKLPELLAPSSE